MITRSGDAYWMPFCTPRRSSQSVSTAPTYVRGTWIVTLKIRLFDVLDRAAASGSLRRVVDVDHRRRRSCSTLVDDARRGRDEVEVVLALEPLLDDLHVQQAEEAAAEAEAERLRACRARTTNAASFRCSFVERVAQVVVLGAVGREDAREHHRLHFLEAGQRLGRRVAPASVTVSPILVSWTRLDVAGEEADLARAELVERRCAKGANTPISVTS